jgi:hypothetical protein
MAIVLLGTNADSEYQSSWPHGGGFYASRNRDRLTTDVARFWVVIALVIILLVLITVARRKP